MPHTVNTPANTHQPHRSHPTARRVGARALPLALVAALALAACGDDTTEPAGTEPATTEPVGSSSGTSFEGRTWLSTGASGFEIVEGSVVRLSFEDGSISANAGCNSMSGGYTLEGDVLRIGAMASTQMACDDPLMDQDARLSELLSSGPSVSVEGDELVLTSGDTSITFLDREIADPDRPLEGTEWTVTGVIANEAVSSGWGEAVATLTIADGTVSVATGCNTGSGSATVGEGTITFGPIATTKMMCDDDAMQLEAAVLAALSGEATYEIEAGMMTLMSGSQGLQLTAP